MRASTRNAPARRARREVELTRMSLRADMEPRCKDFYDGEGNRISATYLGHVSVPARGIQRKPASFATLMASVSRLYFGAGTTRAQQEMWTRLPN